MQHFHLSSLFNNPYEFLDQISHSQYVSFTNVPTYFQMPVTYNSGFATGLLLDNSFSNYSTDNVNYIQGKKKYLESRKRKLVSKCKHLLWENSPLFSHLFIIWKIIGKPTVKKHFQYRFFLHLYVCNVDRFH